MLKRIIQLFLSVSILCMSFCCASGYEEDVQERGIVWKADFDEGYSADDTAIKDFDTFESINGLKDGATAEAPDFWDGSYNYLSPASNYNGRVMRVVENGNGIMRFMHTGGTKNEGVYVEKTLGYIPGIPKLTMEYKFRVTVNGYKYWSFYCLKPGKSNTSRLPGIQFVGSTKGFWGCDDDDSDNPQKTFTVNKWYNVKMVYSNKDNTWETYFEGEYLGKTTKNANFLYYRNGEVSFRFDYASIGSNGCVDIDDIYIYADRKLGAESPVFYQDGKAVESFDYSEKPLTAKTEVYNFSVKTEKIAMYVAAYSVTDGRKELNDFSITEMEVPPGKKMEFVSDEFELSSGTDVIHAYLWRDTEPLVQATVTKKGIYIPPEGSFPEFGEVKTLGPAAFARKTCKAATGMTALGYRTYVTFIGSPAYVYEFDALTGEFLGKYQSGSGLHHSVKVGSDGKVYTIPTGSPDLYVYDPVTKENTLIQADICRGSTSWHINTGADGDNSMLYAPIYNNNYATEGTSVIEYDIDNGKISVYDGFDIGCKYAHGATGDDKYVYVSSGDLQGTEKISRMNKETGEITVWKNDTGFVQGQMACVKAVGNCIFTKIGKNIIVIDKETMITLDSFTTSNSGAVCISDPMPGGDPNVVYYMLKDEKGLGSYNMATGEDKVVMKFTGTYGGITQLDFGTWVKKADGKYAIACTGKDKLLNCRLALVVPGETTYFVKIGEYPDSNFGELTTPEFYYVSRDDILYVGGNEAGLNGFDLKTNTPLFSVQNGNQHGMTMVNGMLFGGSYSAGDIYMYDPSKKADIYQGNPKVVKNGVSGVCRHYNSADTNAGFGLITGIADYGGSEGGVFLCTYRDGKPQVKYYGGVIPGENIVGLCYRDGYIYVSSTVTVSVYEPHDEAHISKIDAVTGETVKTVALRLPGSDVRFLKIGEIAFGPDGLLYGIGDAEGTVFAVEPENLELVKYKSFYPGLAASGGVGSSTVRFGDEGNMYAIINNQLHVINPETLENKILWEAVARFALDNDGNIIKKSGKNSWGTSLASITVNPRHRLELMVKNAKKYYKEEDYSKESWQSFAAALRVASEMNIGEAFLPDVKAAARNLGFAIRDLKRIYDAQRSFGYPFD